MKSDEKWSLVASVASEVALNKYFSLSHVVFEHRSYYGTTYSCKERQYKCPLRLKVIDPGKMDVSWVPEADRDKVTGRCYAIYVNGQHTNCSFDHALHADKFACTATVSKKKLQSESDRFTTNISGKLARRAIKSSLSPGILPELLPGGVNKLTDMTKLTRVTALTSVKRRWKKRARDGLDYLTMRMKAVARDRKRRAMQIAQQKMDVAIAVDRPSTVTSSPTRQKGGKKRLLSKDIERTMALYIRRLDKANLPMPPHFIRGFVSELATLMGQQRDSLMSVGWYDQFAVRQNLTQLKTPYTSQDVFAAVKLFQKTDA
uniref:HTH CENPB-type domain-containing protein n=1 Tax=Plectus sambesii TaxID=2011161 RepID=A0A914XF88_9BILA